VRKTTTQPNLPRWQGQEDSGKFVLERVEESRVRNMTTQPNLPRWQGQGSYGKICPGIFRGKNECPRMGPTEPPQNDNNDEVEAVRHEQEVQTYLKWRQRRMNGNDDSEGPIKKLGEKVEGDFMLASLLYGPARPFALPSDPWQLSAFGAPDSFGAPYGFSRKTPVGGPKLPPRGPPSK